MRELVRFAALTGTLRTGVVAISCGMLLSEAKRTTSLRTPATAGNGKSAGVAKVRFAALSGTLQG